MPKDSLVPSDSDHPDELLDPSDNVRPRVTESPVLSVLDRDLVSELPSVSAEFSPDE